MLTQTIIMALGLILPLGVQADMSTCGLMMKKLEKSGAYHISIFAKSEPIYAQTKEKLNDDEKLLMAQTLATCTTAGGFGHYLVRFKAPVNKPWASCSDSVNDGDFHQMCESATDPLPMDKIQELK